MSMPKHEIVHWLRESFDPDLTSPEEEVAELAEKLWRLDFERPERTGGYTQEWADAINAWCEAELVEPRDIKPEVAEAVRLIDDSETHDRIARGEYTPELHEALVAACDDWTHANDGAREYWGPEASDGGMTWRVLLVAG